MLKSMLTIGMGVQLWMEGVATYIVIANVLQQHLNVDVDNIKSYFCGEFPLLSIVFW